MEFEGIDCFSAVLVFFLFGWFIAGIYSFFHYFNNKQKYISSNFIIKIMYNLVQIENKINF